METTKYYGVRRVMIKGKWRYSVTCDGYRTHDMNYAKYDFAVNKARAFALAGRYAVPVKWVHDDTKA